jgi:hypothetical protein
MGESQNDPERAEVRVADQRHNVVDDRDALADIRKSALDAREVRADAREASHFSQQEQSQDPRAS